MALIDTNRTRLVRKALPTDSFFNFFSPPEPPTDEALENGEFEDEELEELEEKLEEDYQIGEDLKEKVRFSPILPHGSQLTHRSRLSPAPSTTSPERRSNMT